MLDLFTKRDIFCIPPINNSASIIRSNYQNLMINSYKCQYQKLNIDKIYLPKKERKRLGRKVVLFKNLYKIITFFDIFRKNDA